MNPTRTKFAAMLRVALGIDKTTNTLALSETEEQEIFDIAKFHDLLHLLFLAATAIGNDDLVAKTKQEYLKAIKRKAVQDLTLKEIRDIFENEKIDYIALKGAVICDLYPEAWMRKSGDLDILVRVNDYQKAVSLLTDQKGFKPIDICSHCTEMVDDKGVHVEIHKYLHDSADVTRVDEEKFVDEIWNAAKPIQNEKHEYEMSDEWFYLYHIAHMIRHFEHGGCGIKFFIDLWYMTVDGPKSNRDALLEKHGYKKFEEVSVAFSKVLFEGIEDDSLDDFENYIFNAGAFGSTEQMTNYRSLKYGGKIQYLCKRAFMPREQLMWSYPILEKHPVLTPACEVARWFRLIFKDKKVNNGELQAALDTNSDSAETVKRVREMVGL